MKRYRLAVVGAGMVGKKMVEILVERDFPYSDLKILATREREEEIAGRSFRVEKTGIDSFKDVDIALFAGTEGEKGASRLFGWEAVKGGTTVIDNGGDYRMDPRVPLVIPEINSRRLKNHEGFIANPNCSTIQMLMAVFPIHKEYQVEKIIVSTYQAVSGTGKNAVEELKRQVADYAGGRPAVKEIYPYQIAFNAIPEIGSQSEEFPGYYSEEVKMIKETHKILECPEMKISATCVRVPVFNGHAESVTLQCGKTPDIERVKELIGSFPGTTVMDDPSNSLYPTPLEISGKDDVFVGRIRKNTAMENAIDIWVVGDNIRKGAALNTVQIAEELTKEKT